MVNSLPLLLCVLLMHQHPMLLQYCLHCLAQASLCMNGHPLAGIVPLQLRSRVDGSLLAAHSWVTREPRCVLRFMQKKPISFRYHPKNCRSRHR